MSRPRIEAFPDTPAWADACAERVTTALRGAIAERGRAAFAGSGGSTPEPIYRRMAGAELDWARVTVTLVDERQVPETSDLSNAALLKRSLLTGPAASARFVPLYSPQITLDRAALVASHALDAAIDRLDVALLGMGEDGHIASIFPGNPIVKQLLSLENPARILPVARSRSTTAPEQDRLSMNLPWLASAGRVVVALTGARKREVFEREAASDSDVSPVARLIAARGGDLDILWTEAP